MRLVKLVLLIMLLLPFARANARRQSNPPRVIRLKIITGLQYDLARFQVKPGEKIIIELTNTDDMSHNLLITKPGMRLDVVNAAQKLDVKGPAMNYTPISSNVLAAIPVLNPGQTRSLKFTAPVKPGVYPYVCTLPGHGFVMYGAMYVQAGGAMPNLKTDPNIPPGRRQETDKQAMAHHTMKMDMQPKPLHPYTPVPPYLYRVFIEGSSPAAIAVSLPNKLSYCWDAGTCRLRFAWSGGFLDNSDLWKGKGDALAKVVGTIFYRDKTSYPLYEDKPGSAQSIHFKGYRLVNRYPEFHYTLNGTDVYELIKPKTDGSGLLRTFRIPAAATSFWLVTDAQDGVNYTGTTGKWKDGRLELSAAQAKQFTIVMTMKREAVL